MDHELNPPGQPLGFRLSGWHPPAPLPRETMEGVFCRVEPLDPDRHARSLFEANALDAERRNWTYLSYGPFDTFESYHAWLARFAGSTDSLNFAVVDRASDRAGGVAGYNRIDPPNGSVEIGHINFSPLIQHRPASTEAIYLMMRRVFCLGYRRCEWKANALNAASRRAAQRLGFSFEGIFRQAMVSKGRNRDSAWYSVIDREWPALEAAFLRWLDPANFDDGGEQKISLSSLTAPLLQTRG